jgi:hypothetical protein
VPLVTGGGNDPPSLADDVERRGISGTGAPTTKMKGALSNKELIIYLVTNDVCITTFTLEPHESIILPAETGLASNDVGPAPSKDELCTLVLLLDFVTEDLAFDV